MHIVPDNHKRQKALSANPGQWSRSQHCTKPLEEPREANQIEDHGAADQDAIECEGCDGFARTDAAGQALRLHEGNNRKDDRCLLYTSDAADE